MEEATVMMVGLEWPRIREAMGLLYTQCRGADRTLRTVSDYDVPNVSDKVVRIIPELHGLRAAHGLGAAQ